MKLNVRVLHTDGSISRHKELAPRYRKTINASAYIGSMLRMADPSVAALRIDGVQRYEWVGHINDEQAAAKRKAEIANANW